MHIFQSTPDNIQSLVDTISLFSLMAYFDFTSYTHLMFSGVRKQDNEVQNVLNVESAVILYFLSVSIG